MLRALAFGLTLLMPLAALAAVPSAVSASTAQQLLQKMAQATRAQDYTGRFLYQFGGEISTMEVRHAVLDGKEYQRLTHLDGHISEVVRQGDELFCLYPDGSLTRLSDGEDGLFNFRARLAGTIPEQYNVLLDGDGRIAGRAATRVRVVPLDDHRYGYRLWLDDASSLLLKSELVDDNGVALERVEFITLDVNPQLDLADFRIPRVLSAHTLRRMPALRGRVQIHTAWLPGGFAAVEKDWRRISAARPPVVAQSFSDGLATFTLFVEPVSGNRVTEGSSRVGPTIAITRHVSTAGHHYLVTLVGEIPQSTAERVTRGVGISIPHSR